MVKIILFALSTLAIFTSSQMIVGNLRGVSVTDLKVVNLTNFAIKEYNKENNKSSALIKINNANEQIVAGVLYELNVTTNSLKSNCSIKCFQLHYCNFRVLVQSWLNSTKLLNSQCTP